MHKRFALKTLTLAGALTAMGMISVGCAVSDYRGWLSHQTQAEARLWGSEVAFVTGDPNLDGTYSYTVKYDFRGTTTVPTGTYPDKIVITTYRNPVVAAFSRDGCVDRDGDDIQQRAGDIAVSCDNAVAAGKFAPKWRFGDANAGCQFFTNYEQTFGSPKDMPGAALCNNAPVEEVDKDLDLQAEAFSSLDDFFGRIWSGAVGASFAANVTNVSFNGKTVNLDVPLGLGVRSNGVRPTTMSVDLTSPGGQALVRAVLANTTNGATVQLRLGFEGGMSISPPALMTVAFNHDALTKLLK